MLQNFLKELNLKTRESVRIDCPICFNKNTFSATNDGRQTIYNCFHVDCNIKGGYSGEAWEKGVPRLQVKAPEEVPTAE